MNLDNQEPAFFICVWSHMLPADLYTCISSVVLWEQWHFFLKDI